MMSLEQNIQIVEKLWERSNSLGPESLIEFLDVNYVRHAARRDYSRAEFIDTLAERRIAFPDLESKIVDILAQHDKVAYRWESFGSHQGAYLGIPPTGRLVHAEGITISRFQGGKIVEDWGSWNKNSVLHSLGVLPIPETWGEG